MMFSGSFATKQNSEQAGKLGPVKYYLKNFENIWAWF